MTGDNIIMLSYKWWFVFSQPLRLLVALSGIVVAAIGTAPGLIFLVGNTEDYTTSRKVKQRVTQTNFYNRKC